jgi:hypothetical protein
MPGTAKGNAMKLKTVRAEFEYVIAGLKVSANTSTLVTLIRDTEAHHKIGVNP